MRWRLVPPFRLRPRGYTEPIGNIDLGRGAMTHETRILALRLSTEVSTNRWGQPTGRAESRC
jgi:hypothetical protein